MILRYHIAEKLCDWGILKSAAIECAKFDILQSATTISLQKAGEHIEQTFSHRHQPIVCRRHSFYAIPTHKNTIYRKGGLRKNVANK